MKNTTPVMVVTENLKVRILNKTIINFIMITDLHKWKNLQIKLVQLLLLSLVDSLLAVYEQGWNNHSAFQI